MIYPSTTAVTQQQKQEDTKMGGQHQFLEPTTPTAIEAAKKRETSPPSAKEEVITIATGCFWGPDWIVKKQYGGKGLISSKVGYIGGHAANPNYKQVCTGSTGHAEAVRVAFDPSKISYAEILEFFLRTHDATDVGGQGGDRGTQYRSAIFTHNDEQATTAKAVIADIEKAGRFGGKKVATEVVPASEWHEAEGYHQDYLDINPNGYHCPSHRPYW
ncbi:hypothetical protein PROFUN_05734 [Planoprotostelium fungivorum]|uniref:peptide-methionine (S)-S-oxide reductase n=1 Tax=Planoprotostelium fungivorum TaxID=1890364 RepID=A0A2P6NQN6_9EUKA|nr:hypothetical protein PROFUN_05734 [Planoprotostelium fungivorum]